MRIQRNLVLFMVAVLALGVATTLNTGQALEQNAPQRGPDTAFSSSGGGFPNPWIEPNAAAQARLTGRDIWRDFNGQHRPWYVEWNENNGTVRTAYGPGIALQPSPQSETDLEALTRAFVDENSELFGLSSSELELTFLQDARNVWSVQYRQVHNGVPVFKSLVDFRVNKDGLIVKFGTRNVLRDLSLKTIPAMNGNSATGIVRNRVEGLGTIGDPWTPDLVIYGINHKPVLAWKATVPTSGPAALWSAMVDAKTGKILESWNDLMHVDVTGTASGWSLVVDPCDTVQLNPLEDLQVRIVGGNNAYTNAGGAFTISNGGSSAVTVQADLRGRWVNVNNVAGSDLTFSQSVVPGNPVNITFASAGAGELDIAQVAGFVDTTMIHNHFKDVVPTATQIDQVLPCNVNLNDTCNAYYDYSSINFFRSGGGCNNTGFRSVVAHEYGHYVDDEIGGITDGGLSEGIGDLLSISLLGDPIIGDCFFTGGGNIRNADNNLQWPSCSGVHACGEIMAGFAWDMRVNLIATYGALAGKALFDDISLNAVNANPSSIPDFVLDCFIQDDNDGDVSNGTPNYADICAAASAHNFSCPTIVSPISIVHTPIADTGDTSNPYTATAVITSGEGSITSADLTYRTDGGSFTTVSMSPTANPDEFSAQIPAQSCPTDVEYYISATDSAANSNTNPVGAPGSLHGFLVADVSVLFFDDFEGGDNGWTHNGTGQDDWQRGAPQGNSTDPSSAVSGIAVWANDLGNSGWNGNYQPDVNNNLLSPIIDATGETGVRLQFWRWLGVEDGVYDHARIYVNGTQVWTNPSGSGSDNLIDTQWVFQDIDISAIADNNPSVQIRFNMDSDGGVEFGGWTLDDLRLVTIDCLTPPDLLITITPATTTIARGTKLHMDVHVENLSDGPLTVDYWLEAFRPGGLPYAGNPVGLTNVTIPSGGSVDRHFAPRVPNNAPLGTGYQISSMTGASHPTEEASDSFLFEVIAPAGAGLPDGTLGDRSGGLDTKGSSGGLGEY